MLKGVFSLGDKCGSGSIASLNNYQSITTENGSFSAFWWNMSQ